MKERKWLINVWKYRSYDDQTLTERIANLLFLSLQKRKRESLIARKCKGEKE